VRAPFQSHLPCSLHSTLSKPPENHQQHLLPSHVLFPLITLSLVPPWSFIFLIRVGTVEICRQRLRQGPHRFQLASQRAQPKLRPRPCSAQPLSSCFLDRGRLKHRPCSFLCQQQQRSLQQATCILG